VKPKIILCLALVWSAVLTGCASGVRAITIKMPDLNEPIYLTEQPTQITVQMPVTSFRVEEKHISSKASDLHRQVCLLRADGSSIPQLHEPDVIGISNGGYVGEYLFFSFQKKSKSMNEVARIIVSMDGKTHCMELEGNSDKP
jgi:hypothetical protein